MKILGQTLKEARERKEISLESLFEKLRIPLETMRQVEKGIRPDLPETYIRAFIRTWARDLDLNADTLLREYDERAGRSIEKEGPEEELQDQPEGETATRKPAGRIIWITGTVLILTAVTVIYIRVGKKLFTDPDLPVQPVMTAVDSAAVAADPDLAENGEAKPGIKPEKPAAAVLVGSLSEEELYKAVPEFRRNKSAYNPDLTIIRKLESYKPSLNCIAFFGTYDTLSQDVIAKLLRIKESGYFPDIHIDLIGLDWEGRDLAGLTKLHRVQGIPTIVLLSRGRELGRVAGQPAESIESLLLAIIERSRPE